MAGRIDKAKLNSAISSVGNGRMSGVQHGATVNTERPKDQAKPAAPVLSNMGQGGEAGPGPLNSALPLRDVPVAPLPAVDPADAKTERVAFLCSPKVKKHLKRLAIDHDKDVSKLILEALAAKGYLP